MVANGDVADAGKSFRIFHYSIINYDEFFLGNQAGTAPADFSPDLLDNLLSCDRLQHQKIGQEM